LASLCGGGIVGEVMLFLRSLTGAVKTVWQSSNL